MPTELNELSRTQLNETLPEKVKELSINDAVKSLTKFGGFDIVGKTIDGAENLNPKSKPLEEMFLNDEGSRGERKELKKRLQLILEMLTISDSMPKLVENVQEKLDKTQTLLKTNVKKALDATRDLERSYRSVQNFYKNSDQNNLQNVHIMNAPPEELRNLENPAFIDAVEAELKANYDVLDLRNNYSMLVVPGYLGAKTIVDKWARLAHKNKVMLVTDFVHLDKPQQIIDRFTKADLTGGDIYLSNVMMTCNWLVGRGKQADVDEEEDLFVPPSTAVAGKMYNTLMAQVAAGRKDGALNEIDGVKFPLLKGEIAQLDKIGLIPLVSAFGKVMPFSAKTLFAGDNLGLQTYSVVRVFDYVAKVLMDFLNRRAFQNFNVNTRMDMQKEIVKFLDGIAGPGKLIEKFKILKFEQDPKQKDRIYLDIYMVPFFPAKNFMIKLDGQKGLDPDSAEWKAEYEQNK